MSSCGLVMLDKFRGMNLISWFPCVVTVGVSLPFNEVLEPFRSSELSVCDDSFDFVFVFSVDKVRGWLGEVWAVCRCFMIGSQQGCVKHIVDFPIYG